MFNRPPLEVYVPVAGQLLNLESALNTFQTNLSKTYLPCSPDWQLLLPNPRRSPRRLQAESLGKPGTCPNRLEVRAGLCPLLLAPLLPPTPCPLL